MSAPNPKMLFDKKKSVESISLFSWWFWNTFVQINNNYPTPVLGMEQECCHRRTNTR